MKEPELAIEVLNIDHLGIIAGIMDEMELEEEVNKKVGIKSREIVSPGQAMKAMILNGLGFLSAPLYLFEQFFVGKATEHLIGKGVLPSHLNDDRLESVFVSRLKEIKKQWTFEGVNVADSALYTADNISAMRELKWITRVPLSIKSAQIKILDIKPEQWEKSQISGYKIAEKESNYGEIKQRWLIIESEARKESSIQQVNKQVEKQKEKSEALLRKLYRQEFACQPDAKIAIERLSNSLKYHEIKDIEYFEKASYTKSGRPSKSTEINQKRSQVKGKLDL